MNLSHVPIGHWGKVLSSGFKKTSRAEFKCLGTHSVGATTQRKRELWNWVTQRGRLAPDRPWCQEMHSFRNRGRFIT